MDIWGLCTKKITKVEYSEKTEKEEAKKQKTKPINWNQNQSQGHGAFQQ